MGVRSIVALSNIGPKPVSTYAVAQVVSFSDISGNLYRVQIQRAASLGFIAGFTEDNGTSTFRPDTTVTREQAVSIILAAIGKTENDWRGLPNRFTDVPNGRWSTEKIAYAASQGIVAGRKPGIFDPLATVTRAELMAMLRKVANSYFAGHTQGATVNFSDTTSHWANEAIAYMSSYCGVATPYNEQGTNFAPDLGATRGYTAAAIVRLADCGQTPPPPSTLTPTPPRGPTKPSPNATLPRTVRITGVQGTGARSQVVTSENASPRPVEAGVVIEDKGNLEVNDEGLKVTFGFIGGDGQYQNMFVQTQGSGFYRFRCDFKGNFLIGWNATSSACNEPGDRLRIIKGNSNTKGSNPYVPNPSTLTTGQFRADSKQLDDSASDVLLVDPTDGVPTLIDIRLDENTDTYTIKVWQGSIDIKSSEDSQGVTVNAGQEYIYQGGDATKGRIDTFNKVPDTASTCSTFADLALPNAVSPETPDDLSRAIAEQLKQHQAGLGLVGTPATNLSPDEQAIVDEINQARSNPKQYALKLQQFYKSGQRLNRLFLLTGQTIDSPDVINSLNNARSLSPLTTSVGVSNASRDLVEQQLPINDSGYAVSSEQSSLIERLGRYGTIPCKDSGSRYFDQILYYSEESAKDTVMRLVANPDTSNTILNPYYRVIGVACASRQQGGQECAITFTPSYLENSQ
jgi:hypothetical protein